MGKNEHRLPDKANMLIEMLRETKISKIQQHLIIQNLKITCFKATYNIFIFQKFDFFGHLLWSHWGVIS